MITSILPYSDPSNIASPGQGYDGVVRVSVSGYYGTGVLLYDGRAILTAAHLFNNGATGASVRFETVDGIQTISAGKVSIDPDYDPVNENNDLALVWLSGSAPSHAERYNLYRDDDEIGKSMTLVGYGTPGTGTGGVLSSYSGAPVRLKAENQADADAGTLKSYLGSAMSWTPTPGTQLVVDFDDGTAAHDALGRLIDCYNSGLGNQEGFISPGDSGGPAFIDGKIAGIASYAASLSQGSSHPDIDNTTDSSFGEIAAWQRVSHYQQWIDRSLRAEYKDAPTKPSEVQTSVHEGNSGASLAYFLLNFTGIRTDPSQVLSVDFATRNGSATAGEDYLPISGRLNLYPGESQAVIPVEIIGDCIAEPNETFYLDVTNPVGGSFGAGVTHLTAMRTILNDDGGMLG